MSRKEPETFFTTENFHCQALSNVEAQHTIQQVRLVAVIRGSVRTERKRAIYLE
jgi:hypothetical protein